MTNNPTKIDYLKNLGIIVESREKIITIPNNHNLSYLKAKQAKLGHLTDI